MTPDTRQRIAWLQLTTTASAGFGLLVFAGALPPGSRSGYDGPALLGMTLMCINLAAQMWLALTLRRLQAAAPGDGTGG